MRVAGKPFGHAIVNRIRFSVTTRKRWDLHVTFSGKDPIVDAMGVPDWNIKPESCEPDSIL
jgi:hypothetical protein